MKSFRTHLETTLALSRGILVTLYMTVIGMIRALVPTGYLPRKSVAGDIVLITGSGSGIGRRLAIKFAQLGSRLVLWDIDQHGNEETKRLVEESGVAAEVKVYKVDLSDREDVERAAEAVKADMGPVDILINNAGIVTGKKLLQSPDTLIQRTMDVNINAHFWTTKAFLGSMIERNRGHLVYVTSAAGLFGTSGLADYCASKFAVVGLAESVLLELTALDKTGVHVCEIAPYFINTGMFDGVVSKWPSLFPILEPEYAVEKIMDTILTNTPVLLMPRFIYFVYFLKGFLPITAALYLGRFFGVTETMDTFKGRKAVRA